MNLSKIKPIIKCLVPTPLLRGAKQAVRARIVRQIAHTEKLPYDPNQYPSGINLIGPIDAATGLGQSFRLIERVFDRMDMPYLIYNYEQNTRNRIQADAYQGKIQTELKYAINLWHVNPFDFAGAFAVMGRKSFDGRYNIAYWLWELEDFPDEWTPYIRLLDEIWTPSEFISNGIRKKTDKPVYTVPYCVTAKADTEHYGRKFFALPEDPFLFLMMYDSLSVKDRKNPEGVIQAFRAAFSPKQRQTGLIIKVNSADQKELKYIRELTGNYQNIYIINKNLSKLQVNSLIACADAVVSLHHAEGFGLVLAEAMLNHVPVIATNWSANTEFMNPDIACMVDFELKVLEKDYYPYKKGCRWADPNIADAAEYMKRLAEDREYGRTLAERAYHYIQNKLGMDAAKALVEKRLREIRNGK